MSGKVVMEKKQNRGATDGPRKNNKNISNVHLQMD